MSSYAATGLRTRIRRPHERRQLRTASANGPRAKTARSSFNDPPTEPAGPDSPRAYLRKARTFARWMQELRDSGALDSATCMAGATVISACNAALAFRTGRKYIAGDERELVRLVARLESPNAAQRAKQVRAVFSLREIAARAPRSVSPSEADRALRAASRVLEQAAAEVLEA